MKKEENKKSQVSVFVIFAIIIVAAIGVGYFINKNVSENKYDNKYFESAEVKPQFEDFIKQIDDCYDEISLDSLYLIGLQGGYYKQPKESIDFGLFFVPNYYKEGVSLMPEKSNIENELALYVKDNAGYCFKKIKNDGNFELNYKNPEVSVQINKEDVKFDISVSLNIKKGTSSIVYDFEKSQIIKSKLSDIYDLAKYITDNNLKDPNKFCISCVAD